MTEEQFDAVSMLKAWARDFGKDKEPTFIRHLNVLIDMAETAVEQDVPAILMSDEFLTKFAAAFANTPLPSTISVASGLMFEDTEPLIQTFVEVGRQ